MPSPERIGFSIKEDAVCRPHPTSNGPVSIPDSLVLHGEPLLPEYLKLEGELFSHVLGPDYRDRLAQKTIAIMGAEAGLGHLNPALAIMQELVAHGVGTVPYVDFERAAPHGSRYFRMETRYWAGVQAGITKTQDLVRPLFELVEGPTLKEDIIGIANLALALSLANEFKPLADLIIKLSPETGRKILEFFLKQDIHRVYAPTSKEIVQFLSELNVDVVGGTHWGAIRALLSDPDTFLKWRNKVLENILDPGYGGLGQGFTNSVAVECPGAFSTVPTGGNALSATRYFDHQRGRIFDFGVTSPTPDFDAICRKFSSPPYLWVIATGGNHTHLGTIYRELEEYIAAPSHIQRCLIPVVFLAHHPDNKKSDGVSIDEIVKLIDEHKDLPIQVVRTQTRLEAVMAFHDALKRSIGIDTKGVDQAYNAAGFGAAPVLYRPASPINETSTSLWLVRSGSATFFPTGTDGLAWKEILDQPYRIKRKLYGESLALSPDDAPLFNHHELNIWGHHKMMLDQGMAQQIVFNALVKKTHPYGVCGQTLLLCAMALGMEGLDDMQEGSPGWKLRRAFKEYEATKKAQAKDKLRDFNRRPNLFRKRNLP